MNNGIFGFPLNTITDKGFSRGSFYAYPNGDLNNILFPFPSRSFSVALFFRGQQVTGVNGWIFRSRVNQTLTIDWGDNLNTGQRETTYNMIANSNLNIPATLNYNNIGERVITLTFENPQQIDRFIILGFNNTSSFLINTFINLQTLTRLEDFQILSNNTNLIFPNEVSLLQNIRTFGFNFTDAGNTIPSDLLLVTNKVQTLIIVNHSFSTGSNVNTVFNNFNEATNFEFRTPVIDVSPDLSFVNGVNILSLNAPTWINGGSINGILSGVDKSNIQTLGLRRYAGGVINSTNAFNIISNANTGCKVSNLELADTTTNAQFNWSTLPTNLGSIFYNLQSLNLQQMLSLTSININSTTLTNLIIPRCVSWDRDFTYVPESIKNLDVRGTFNDANSANSVTRVDDFVNEYESWVVGANNTLNIGTYINQGNQSFPNAVPTGVWQSGSSTPMEKLFNLVDTGAITTFVRNYYFVSGATVNPTNVVLNTAFNYGLNVGNSVRVFNVTGLNSATTYTVTAVTTNSITIDASGIGGLTFDTTNTNLNLRSQIYRV
jgi:hypothetical protein